MTVDWLPFCLLVAAAMWARDPKLRRWLDVLVIVDLVRRLCITESTGERVAALAEGRALAAYVGLDRWRWAGGWAATLAWYAVTTWIVAVCLKNNGPTRDIEQGRCRGSERRDESANHRGVPAKAIVVLAAPLAVVALYLAYPALRGRRIELVSVVAYGLALGAQLAVATLACLDWRVPPPDERAPWLTGWILTCSTIASAAGAWALAHPVRDWYATRWIGVLTWAAVGGVHLWALTRRRE